MTATSTSRSRVVTPVVLSLLPCLTIIPTLLLSTGYKDRVM